MTIKIEKEFAYHEAGHVVAAWGVNFSVTFSSAIPGVIDGICHDGYTESVIESDCEVPGDAEQTGRNMEDLLAESLAR